MQVDISSPLLKWPVYNFWERRDEAGRGSTSDQRPADWRPEVQDHQDQDFSHMGHEGAAQAEEPSLVCVYSSDLCFCRALFACAHMKASGFMTAEQVTVQVFRPVHTNMNVWHETSVRFMFRPVLFHSAHLMGFFSAVSFSNRVWKYSRMC